jgi:hypothetical protein
MLKFSGFVFGAHFERHESVRLREPNNFYWKEIQL